MNITPMNISPMALSQLEEKMQRFYDLLMDHRKLLVALIVQNRGMVRIDRAIWESVKNGGTLYQSFDEEAVILRACLHDSSCWTTDSDGRKYCQACLEETERSQA